MPACAVVGCTNRGSSKIKRGFHAFPKDPARLEKWVQRLRRRDKNGKLWYPSKFDRICSDHFLPEDFKHFKDHFRLIETAIPSLFPMFYHKPDEKGHTKIIMRNFDDDDDGDTVRGGCNDDDDNNDDEDADYKSETYWDKGAEGKCNERVLKLQRPFKEKEVMKLVKEYLHLYETIQHLKELARISLDVLCLNNEITDVPEMKGEMNKVQELIDTLINGGEMYKVEVANPKETVNSKGSHSSNNQHNIPDKFSHCHVSKRCKKEFGANPDWDNDDSLAVTFMDQSGVYASKTKSQKTITPESSEMIKRTKTLKSHQKPIGEMTNEIDSDYSNNNAIKQDKQTSKDDDIETVEASSIDDDADEDQNKVTNMPSSNNASDNQLYVKTLKNRLELEKYLECFNDSDKPTCNFCNRPFKSKMSLEIHLGKHLEDKQFICKECGKGYTLRCSWQKHILSHQKKEFNGGDSTHDRFYGKKLKNRFELEEYLESVNENEKPVCKFCDKKLRSKSSLEKHLAHHLEDKQFVCRVCGKEYRLRWSWQRHILSHQMIKRPLCEICGKTFKDPSQLNAHRRLIHIQGPKACPVCGKLVSAINLPRHLRTHRGEKPYKCSVCHKTFTQSTSRNKHQRTHTGFYPYHCSHCGKGFHYLYSLHLHERIHTGEGRFSCSLCGKILMSQTLAKSHTEEYGPSHKVEIRKYNSSEKPYKCSECDSKFVQTIPFALHMLSSHMGELNHCLICNDNVTFVSPQEFELHLNSVHLREKPFMCKICGESFYTLHRFTSHKALHRNKNAFTCRDCGKIYSCYVGLREHRLKYHSLEPTEYICDTCGRKFNTRGNLTRHCVTTHSVVKRFKCWVCGTYFKTRGSRKLHLRTHSKEKLHNCSKCSKGFNDKRNYLSHIKKHHEEVTPTNQTEEVAFFDMNLCPKYINM